MGREKVEERRHFYSYEKKEILSKSRDRCAHCGKKLKLGKELTMEHVVPISKGGTNDISNLVALCKDCNKQKGEKVFLPSSYLTYLRPCYKKELDIGFNGFCKNIHYLSQKNYLFADKIKVDMPVRVTVNSKKETIISTYLYKAYYSDLDDIYSFCEWYYASYPVYVDVWKIVSDYFSRGCIYYSRSRSGEVDFVFFVTLQSTIDPKNDEQLFTVGMTLLCKPDLNLNLYANEAAHRVSLGCIKLLYIIKEMLKGILRGSEDAGVCGEVNSTLFWYEKDERITNFVKCLNILSVYFNPDNRSEGMHEITFYVKNTDDTGVSSWSNYLSNLYNYEDEITLYTVLRDKVYAGELAVKAERLRNLIESRKEETSENELILEDSEE